jgi:hypothetical protein
VRRNAGIAQCQLKGGQPFLMFPNALGKKQPPRDHAFSQFSNPPLGLMSGALIGLKKLNPAATYHTGNAAGDTG